MQEAGADVTLEQALIAAKRRHAPISVESAGYIALAVADALLGSPMVVHPSQIRITEDGVIGLRGAAAGKDERAAEKGVRSLLGKVQIGRAHV